MYTIVVADDEEELRRAIIRKIDWESIGFQVVGEAENGIEALELVERMEPDLLLTDIRMPFVSGIELARQVREVVIPEVDGYVYGVMAVGAGHKPAAVALTKDNIYDEIIKASAALDDDLVPETDRALTVTPATYLLMKKCKDIVMETEIGEEMRIRGVIANLDGAMTIKVAASRLPENFGFMLSHKSACCAPTQLEDYNEHKNPPGINGTLVEGRIVYDAYVFENKKKGIYYQEITA